MKLRSGLALLGVCASAALGQHLLVPMDQAQTDHLRAYGVAYWCLQHGYKVEWLLNYRGGSFLTPYAPEIEQVCKVRGVAYSVVDGATVAQIYKTIDESNMEVVLLEKAPKIAVYVPPTRDPWDDAVRLALEYAEIPYETLWDPDVLAGKLAEYDWVHLHHEDFTGQYGKFYATYRNALWYQKEVALNQERFSLLLMMTREVKQVKPQRTSLYVLIGRGEPSVKGGAVLMPLDERLYLFCRHVTPQAVPELLTRLAVAEELRRGEASRAFVSRSAAWVQLSPANTSVRHATR